MEKAFSIDFIRQAIIQTIRQEYIKQPTKYLGREDQISLVSFYEHLASDEEVNRFVETVRDLNNQQNRTGLIANGTIVAPSNPTITNLNQVTIVPLDFTINFRCTLANRDLVKETLNNMVKLLKGRKQDIAEFDNGKLFMVGTLGNNINEKPEINNGDFIGVLLNTTPTTTVNTFITNAISDLVTNKGFTSNVSIAVGSYLYYEEQSTGKLKVAVLTSDNGWVEVEESTNYPNIIFPPEHNSFTKWKLSISFDSFRCSEPRTLNAEDYCDLSFGGSATLVSASVLLGNEMTKLGIKRYGVKTASGLDTTLADTYDTWLEPLELPSGNGASTTANQLISNKFLNNSHTDGITITRQYTFVYDYNIALLKALFLYGRYGTQTTITPNLLYKVTEIFSAWGNVDTIETTCKLIENVDIENNESDVMTLSLTMQLQGDND